MSFVFLPKRSIWRSFCNRTALLTSHVNLNPMFLRTYCPIATRTLSFQQTCYIWEGFQNSVFSLEAKSSDIVSMLRGLRSTFVANKHNLDMEEEDAF